MEPIWNDYYIDLTQFFEGGEQFVDYHIEKDGEVIYIGRAYKAPEGDTFVRINDICADYLGHVDLRDALGAEFNYLIDLSAIGVFTIVAGPDQTEVAVVTFFNDWSYKLPAPGIRSNLSGTISKEYVDLMPIVYTGERTGIGGKTQIAHYHSLGIESLAYKKVQCCNPAALYFFNAQCGWDFLLCKGGAKRVDTFARATTKRPYIGGNDRGTFNYQNTAKVEWDVMTGWIPKEGGKEMWQLLGSTDVWLWTPEEGLVPVVITTNSVEEKNYKLNGRKPVEFTIRVELAQDRQRR